MARVNAVHFQQAQVFFRITWVGMSVGQPADPFNARSSWGSVVEFRHTFENIWSHNPKRDITMLISGRLLGGSQILPPWTCVGGTSPGRWCDDNVSSATCDGGGSCEWTGATIGIKERAYIVLQHRHPNLAQASTINANNAAHEIGHIFGAEHTHCQQPPVDECSGGGLSMRMNACFAGPAQAPFGSPPSYIMSYCPVLFGTPYRLEFSAPALSADQRGPSADDKPRAGAGHRAQERRPSRQPDVERHSPADILRDSGARDREFAHRRDLRRLGFGSARRGARRVAVGDQRRCFGDAGNDTAEGAREPGRSQARLVVHHHLGPQRLFQCSADGHGSMTGLNDRAWRANGAPRRLRRSTCPTTPRR